MQKKKRNKLRREKCLGDENSKQGKKLKEKRESSLFLLARSSIAIAGFLFSLVLKLVFRFEFEVDEILT